MMITPTTSASPYYSMASFTLMMPAAVVYSAAVNLAFALLSMVQRRSSNSSSHIERPLPSITMAQRSAAQQNQTTRVAIVTGSNTGIGYETARSLVVDYGYTVILACRSRDKAETAAVRINKLEQQQRSLTTTVTATATATALTPTDTPASTTTKGGRAVFVHPLDLSSLDSVREFCAALKLHYPQQNIDVLINNAGRSTNGSSSSSLISGTTSGEKRNLDLLFQSNFLGHFLLTSLLLEHNHSSNNNCVTVRPSDERKIEAPHFRIVNLSSVMHHFCGGNMSIVSIGDDLESADFWKNAATAGQDPTDTYALSKLAALLFTIELNRRYGAVVDDDDDDGRNKNSNNKQHNVRSFAVNPGSVNSDIWRDFPRFLIPLFSLFYLTNAQGCRTSVVASVAFNPLNNVDDIDNAVYYLQPYWLPQYYYSTAAAAAATTKAPRPPFPVCEMLGPYQGYRATTPRLPVADGGRAAAAALWAACTELTGATWPSSSSSSSCDKNYNTSSSD